MKKIIILMLFCFLFIQGCYQEIYLYGKVIKKNNITETIAISFENGSKGICGFLNVFYFVEEGKTYKFRIITSNQNQELYSFPTIRDVFSDDRK